MKDLLKGWNKFEKILLFSSIGLVILSGFLYKSEMLTVIASLTGIICALLQAKGKVVSQFVGVIETILYSILSFKNQYYGEVIIYIIIMFPLYVLGIISWIKNKKEDSDVVEQNTIARKEWILLTIVNIVLFIILYLVLKHFNTNQLFVSTLSMITSLCATYLIVRRSKYSFIFYILNDIILLILWGLPVFNGDLLLIPMVIEPIVLLVNDSYGWKNWKDNI